MFTGLFSFLSIVASMLSGSSSIANQINRKKMNDENGMLTDSSEYVMTGFNALSSVLGSVSSLGGIRPRAGKNTNIGGR